MKEREERMEKEMGHCKRERSKRQERKKKQDKVCESRKGYVSIKIEKKKILKSPILDKDQR